MIFVVFGPPSTVHGVPLKGESMAADVQRVRSIVDFVLDLSQNPDKSAEYKADPTGYMTSQGFDEQLQQEILRAQEPAMASHSGTLDDHGTTVMVVVVVV